VDVANLDHYTDVALLDIVYGDDAELGAPPTRSCVIVSAATTGPS
jgi:hypothetical protein